MYLRLSCKLILRKNTSIMPMFTSWMWYSAASKIFLFLGDSVFKDCFKRERKNQLIFENLKFLIFSKDFTNQT